MNICLLNDSFPPVIDGVANVVMNYGKILTRDLGANVIVGTPKYPGENYDGYPYKVVPYKSLDTTDFIAGYRTGNPLAMREIGQMAEFAPDIIHTHCPASSTIMARILQNETGAPIVFTYHTKFDVDIARAVGDGFLKNETIKAMISNISACDEVWVVSQGAGENLKSLGYEGEYRVVSNGVDFPKGRADDLLVAETTKDYDLPKDVPMFLFVGRIMKYKGLPIIIDAMKLLDEKGIDFRMVFVGGGADADEMKEKVKGYGLESKVIFTGPEHDREKLRAWNTRADLFLFPSVYDTNGIVVREAAACGLGSVLIEGSCAAEGITHGRNGYLIEENAESMAVLLEEVSKNLDNAHDVGQHAMDEIYISWEDSVKDAYRRYEEIRQMVADGRIVRRKKHGSDYFLESAAGIVKGTEHVFDIPRNIYGGMKENFEEFKDNVEEFRDNLEEFRGNFSENLKGNIEEFRDNISENLKDNIEDIKDLPDNIKDNIKDNFNEMKEDWENLKEKTIWKLK